MKWNKSDLVLWLIIFFLITLIMGLYQAEGHRVPPSLFDRTKANTQSHQLLHEGFEGREGYETSSTYDIAGGASANYGYKYTESSPNPTPSASHDDYERKQYRGEILPEQVPKRRCTKKEEDKDAVDCYRDDDEKHRDDYCHRCDILINEDIDKYVLKSSVPPMPNMSEYIRKNEIPACRNENINLDDYVHKSQIPKLLRTDCPACPACPTIPDDLLMHKPQFKAIRPEDIENLLQDARVKAYLDKKYTCPKTEASTSPSIASKFFPPAPKEESVSGETPPTEEERIRPTMQIVKKKKPSPTPTPTTPTTPEPPKEEKKEPDFIQRIWNIFLSLFGIESYENLPKMTPSVISPHGVPGLTSPTISLRKAPRLMTPPTGGEPGEMKTKKTSSSSLAPLGGAGGSPRASSSDFSEVPFLSPPSYNSDQRLSMIYNHTLPSNV